MYLSPINRNVFETVVESSSPFSLFPLDRPESRALWKSIRYRHKLNHLKEFAMIKVDLPEDWLKKKFEIKSEVFGQKG